jgi:hypothetical protein
MCDAHTTRVFRKNAIENLNLALYFILLILARTLHLNIVKDAKYLDAVENGFLHANSMLNADP